MPFRATMPVTASGVSAAKVVATIEVPASHHGTFRPERKYSERFEPARRRYAMPTTMLIRKYAATMVQSSQVSVMRRRASGLRWLDDWAIDRRAAHTGTRRARIRALQHPHQRVRRRERSIVDGRGTVVTEER